MRDVGLAEKEMGKFLGRSGMGVGHDTNVREESANVKAAVPPRRDCQRHLDCGAACTASAGCGVRPDPAAPERLGSGEQEEGRYAGGLYV